MAAAAVALLQIDRWKDMEERIARCMENLEPETTTTTTATIVKQL